MCWLVNSDVDQKYFSAFSVKLYLEILDPFSDLWHEWNEAIVSQLWNSIMQSILLSNKSLLFATLSPFYVSPSTSCGLASRKWLSYALTHRAPPLGKTQYEILRCCIIEVSPNAQNKKSLGSVAHWEMSCTFQVCDTKTKCSLKHVTGTSEPMRLKWNRPLCPATRPVLTCLSPIFFGDIGTFKPYLISILPKLIRRCWFFSESFMVEIQRFIGPQIRTNSWSCCLACKSCSAESFQRALPSGLLRFTKDRPLGAT